MSENYLTEDSFNQGIKRLESMITASEARQKKENAQIKKYIAQIQRENQAQKVHTENLESTYGTAIDFLDKRLDDMMSTIQIIFGAMGFFIAILEYVRH